MVFSIDFLNAVQVLPTKGPQPLRQAGSSCLLRGPSGYWLMFLTSLNPTAAKTHEKHMKSHINSIDFSWRFHGLLIGNSYANLSTRSTTQTYEKSMNLTALECPRFQASCRST